ncbi:MAG TPA: hypothetical protein VK253_02845 [Candidatus Binatia bacterium]|nr:hypothetical protein [Candidatus Binatia bacterium]
MVGLSLDFTNCRENTTLHYLPYGVTTIEFTAFKNQEAGFVTPQYSTLSEANMEFVGFADSNRDFYVIWGGGIAQGQYVEKNSTKRMFMQLIHLRKDYPEAAITFEHSAFPSRSQTIKILRATDQNCGKIVDENPGVIGHKMLHFEGTYMPLYYPRWFPPKPEEVKYTVIQKCPEVSIEYTENEDGITSSDVNVFFGKGKEMEQICSVTGDLEYSRMVGELFSLVQCDRVFVLRLWFYWIHKRIEGGFLGTSDSEAQVDASETLGVSERTIEVPDIERFDFVIDGHPGTKTNRVLWCGTDFHYQEYWVKPKTPMVKAKIAGGVDLVYESAKLWPLRYLQQKKYYNPAGLMRSTLFRPTENLSLLRLLLQKQVVQERDSLGRTIRNHVPYIEDSDLGGRDFLSSDSREGAKP